MNKKPLAPTIRSSAAEYLSFIAASGEGGVETVYADENVWLSQKMMGELYGVETHTINYHLKKVFSDSELEEDSVIRDFRITAKDGKNYNTKHYNLSTVIALGYKVNSERAVQFRKWATGIIKEYTIKAYVMDDERLKNDGTILGKKYFEEQLERIREIRLSERKFYQKITDIYTTSIDYDVTALATKRFFATVQNKLHWAIHGQTAAEVVHSRADAEKLNMGLTSWKDAPEGKIQKFDVSIAKNYLSELEVCDAYLFAAECLRFQNNGYADKFEAYSKACASVGIREANLPEVLFNDFKDQYGVTAVAFDDALEVVKELSNSFKLGIVSNGRTRGQIAKLKSTELAPFFSAVVVSEAHGVKKPHHSIFNACLEKLGVTAQESVFIGDNPDADILPAHQLGMYTVWMCNDHFSSPESCDQIANSILDIPRIISLLNTQ